MGARASKTNLRRNTELRQSQKKKYHSIRKKMSKLTQEVEKSNIFDRSRLLQLEIAVKSTTHDLELETDAVPIEFSTLHTEYLDRCAKLAKTVTEKLDQNEQSLENLDKMEPESLKIEGSVFVEDLVKDEKHNKLSITENQHAIEPVAEDLCDDSQKKKKFWSFKKKSKAVEPLKSEEINDTEESHGSSLKDVEISIIEEALEVNRKKEMQRRSQFYDQECTPSYEELEIDAQKQAFKEIHNVRLSISTLEEMTGLYRATNRGNYDYIYDNLNLCLSKLKNLDDVDSEGTFTLRHEKIRAIQQGQQCLNVLDGKEEVPARFNKRITSISTSEETDSIEFLDLTNCDDDKQDINRIFNKNDKLEIDSTTNNESCNIVEASVGVDNLNNGAEESKRSSCHTGDQELDNILHSLKKSDAININVASTTCISLQPTGEKPTLITSF